MSRLPLQASSPEIAQALRSLIAEGGRGNFAIVSAGGAYLQFAAARGDTSILCEAVSNEYLPERQHLGLDQINDLKWRGFDVSEGANFSRRFELAGLQETAKLAAMAVEILEQVYKCGGSAAVEIELVLE